MRRFLGVDGGQSGTTALVGDETGRVIGIGRGPGCRHDGAIAGAISAAIDATGAAGVGFEAACFGLSGGSGGREAALRGLVEAKHYVVTHGAAIALTGALAGERSMIRPGIIVIAGTGSMTFGRNAAGRSARAGGWGYAFGDEGGAFDLVRQALRAALRQEEGWGPPTALRELLLAAAKTSDANDLMHCFYTPAWPRERVAALAPLLDQAAAGGDAIAGEILKSAGQSLAALAGIVRGQLFTQDEPAIVSYTGGVFRSPTVLERFRMLVELEDSIQVEAPRYGSAAGALIEAYRAAGMEILPKDVPIEKR
jgi:N-acetylglucosamine kinase-like BadF-type ATPase